MEPANQVTAAPSSGSSEQSFYRNILENMSDGVYFVDTKRRITYWNKAAGTLSGYQAAEVIGRTCHDNILVHTDSDGCQLCMEGCPLQATFKDMQSREGLMFLKHKRGHRVPVHVHVSPIVDETGRVIGGVEVFRDESAKFVALERAKQMEKLALMDPLTAVGNRRFTERVLSDRAAQLQREGTGYAVLFIDLDHFKSINDTHGHDAGDAVLVAVVRTIESNLRSFDFIGRWGGEEFIVILADADSAAATAVAMRCCSLVQSCAIPWNDATIRPTISIGVAVADHADTNGEVIARADTNLYLAKSTGRDRYCGP